MSETGVESRTGVTAWLDYLYSGQRQWTAEGSVSTKIGLDMSTWAPLVPFWPQTGLIYQGSVSATHMQGRRVQWVRQTQLPPGGRLPAPCARGRRCYSWNRPINGVFVPIEHSSYISPACRPYRAGLDFDQTLLPSPCRCAVEGRRSSRARPGPCCLLATCYISSSPNPHHTTQRRRSHPPHLCPLLSPLILIATVGPAQRSTQVHSPPPGERLENTPSLHHLSSRSSASPRRIACLCVGAHPFTALSTKKTYFILLISLLRGPVALPSLLGCPSVFSGC